MGEGDRVVTGRPSSPFAGSPSMCTLTSAPDFRLSGIIIDWSTNGKVTPMYMCRVIVMQVWAPD